MKPFVPILILFFVASVRADDRAAGLAAFDRKEYREAFSRLGTAHNAAPDDKEVSTKAYVAAMLVTKELLSAKQYREALDVSEWALQVNRDILPEESRFVASFNKGQALLGLDRAGEAITWFKEAKELTSNPVVLRMLGQAYYKKEDWSEAAATLSRYAGTAGVKKDVGLTQHLANATYHAGDIAKALELVRQALVEFPSDATLLALEAKFRREDRTEGTMQQSAGVYFDVKFEDLPDQQDLRAKILKALDEAYQQVTRDFSHYPDKNVPVVIYPSSVSFASGAGAPNWAAANFDGKIRIPAEAAKASDESLRRVVTHEFTHYIVDRVSKRNCPTWLHEGLAQIEEKNDKEWAGTTLRRFMGNRNLRARLFDLSTLEGSFSGIRDSELVSLAYAESYLATKYIVDRNGMQEINLMLESLASGSSFADVLYHRQGSDSAGFQKQWLTSQAEEFHIDW